MIPKLHTLKRSGKFWLIALAIALTTGSWAAAQDAPKVLRVAIPAPIPALGPSFSTGFPDQTVYGLIFDPLVDFGPDMSIRGRLATSWELVSPTVWEFKLRQGVTFQNGDPFTAADVKANFDWILNPDNKAAYIAYVKSVSEVEIVDDYTVRLHTSEPYPTLPAQLVDRYMFPGDYLEKVGPDGFNAHPIGTGAFSFQEMVPGQKIVVTANKDYWDGAPALDGVEVYPIPEPSTRANALIAGNVDLITKPPLEQLDAIKSNPNIKVTEYPTLAVLALVMNTREGPLADQRVRQAIHYAVNTQELIDTLLQGAGKPVVGQLVPGVPGHNPDLQPYTYDPEKARSLLADAGYANGFPLTIHAPSGRYAQDIQLAEAVAGYLQEVGIQAQAEPIEWGRLIGGLSGNPMLDGMYMIGNSQYDLDPAGFYQGYVWSDFRGVYFSTPELDALGKQARTELDPDKRAALYQELEQKTWDAAFWLPLTQRYEILAMRSNVDFAPRQIEYLYLREASMK